MSSLFYADTNLNKGVIRLDRLFELVRPNLPLEKEIVKYKEEFSSSNGDIDGSSSLNNFDKLEDWLKHLMAYERRETLPNKNFVPCVQYILLDPKDNKVIGMLHLRLELNDQLKQIGGHIGYSIEPSERRKGYGTYILREGLKKAKKFQIDNIFITCDDDNIGSKKVIENNKGELKKTVYSEARKCLIRHYWIAND